MSRIATSCLLLFVIPGVAFAQSQQARSAACNFQDGNQISVRYQSVPAGVGKLAEGKIWSPGNVPMFLFTSVPLKVENFEIPVGAYSLYLIPDKQQWTLVLNKNVAENGSYNEREDLLRAPMDIGTLSRPEANVSLYFGHVAPKQCNMRVYYGKTGSWIEFREK